MPVPLTAKIPSAVAVVSSVAVAAMRVVENCILSFGGGVMLFFDVWIYWND